MKHLSRLVQPLALLVFMACTTGATAADDLSQPVMLVASGRLEGSGYEQTVLIAAPLPQGGHIGFIINRPTSVKLSSIFPDHAPSRKVVAPVYVGGPLLSDAIFAVTRKAPDGSDAELPLMPGLVVVLDRAGVDRVIETKPNDARYFVGLVVWRPDELEDEVGAGAWDVRPADAKAVFRANPAGLWKDLRGTTSESDSSGTWT